MCDEPMSSNQEASQPKQKQIAFKCRSVEKALKAGDRRRLARHLKLGAELTKTSFRCSACRDAKAKPFFVSAEALDEVAKTLRLLAEAFAPRSDFPFKVEIKHRLRGRPRDPNGLKNYLAIGREVKKQLKRFRKVEAATQHVATELGKPLRTVKTAWHIFSARERQQI